MSYTTVECPHCGQIHQWWGPQVVRQSLCAACREQMAWFIRWSLERLADRLKIENEFRRRLDEHIAAEATVQRILGELANEVK